MHDNAKKWFDRALVAVGGDASRVNMPAGMNMTMMNISSIGWMSENWTILISVIVLLFKFVNCYAVD